MADGRLTAAELGERLDHLGSSGAMCCACSVYQSEIRAHIAAVEASEKRLYEGCRLLVDAQNHDDVAHASDVCEAAMKAAVEGKGDE